jgi:DNA-binding transcriptional LysR family regulator
VERSLEVPCKIYVSCATSSPSPNENVGRAAEQLHISQSPLSRQIAQLEDNLGLALFERRNQRLYLTNDGRTFLAEARGLLKHAERLESLGKRLGPR